MKRFGELLMAAGVSLAALSLPGCAGSPPDVPVGVGGSQDQELVLGRDVFARRCASCHGVSGGGGAGPKLSDGAVVMAYPDADDQRHVIVNGRKAMPSFANRLSDEEIDAVVRYTREVLS